MNSSSVQHVIRFYRTTLHKVDVVISFLDAATLMLHPTTTCMPQNIQMTGILGDIIKTSFRYELLLRLPESVADVFLSTTGTFDNLLSILDQKASPWPNPTPPHSKSSMSLQRLSVDAHCKSMCLFGFGCRVIWILGGQ